MKIHQIINSVFNSNTFVINDNEKAIIIDLGDFEPVKKYLHDNNLSPITVLITHVHYDHIYGIPEFMKEFPNVPIYTSELGKESFKNPKWNFSRYHDDPISIDSPQIKVIIPPQSSPIREGVCLPLYEKPNTNPKSTLPGGDLEGVFGGDLEGVCAFPTPGHDHSCLTYQIGDALFTGDSYIPDVKVVDTFPKSDKALAKEWYTKLEEMSKDFDIYPGHGEVKYKNVKIGG